jgi:hypothetical protein
MLMSMRYLWLGALLWTTLAELAIAQASSGPITFERIQNSKREPQNWLTDSGSNMGRRYSRHGGVPSHHLAARYENCDAYALALI